VRWPCAWCAGETQEALGVYLSQISKGRRICVECGRFTLHCECEWAGSPLPEMGETDVRLPLLSTPGLVN
jgi:hypothetical protein